jgi:hypothetical protein
MEEGVNIMVPEVVKAKHKKTSKGQRTHVRRMKQEARKGPILDSRINKKSRKIEIIKEAVPTIEK